MKKFHFMSSLLAIALLSTALPLQAAKQMSFKQRAKKQFNESLDRFNRCIKGDCSKMEALKAARDVGVAAITVAGMVAAGAVLFRKMQTSKPIIGDWYAGKPSGDNNKINYYQVGEVTPNEIIVSYGIPLLFDEEGVKQGRTIHPPSLPLTKWKENLRYIPGTQGLDHEEVVKLLKNDYMRFFNLPIKGGWYAGEPDDDKEIIYYPVSKITSDKITFGASMRIKDNSYSTTSGSDLTHDEWKKRKLRYIPAAQGLNPKQANVYLFDDSDKQFAK